MCGSLYIGNFLKSPIFSQIVGKHDVQNSEVVFWSKCPSSGNPGSHSDSSYSNIIHLSGLMNIQTKNLERSVKGVKLGTFHLVIK